MEGQATTTCKNGIVIFKGKTNDRTAIYTVTATETGKEGSIGYSGAEYIRAKIFEENAIDRLNK